MRMSVSVSEVNAKQTMVRSGDHHQIWFGTPDIFLMFDSDSAMLAFATDLYSKVLAAVPDDVITETRDDRSQIFHTNRPTIHDRIRTFHQENNHRQPDPESDGCHECMAEFGDAITD